MFTTRQVNTFVKCYHCGEDCRDEHLVFDEKDFCCNGCAQVYQILNGAGMANYYSIERAPGTSQKNKQQGKFTYLDNEDVLNKLLEFNEGDIAKITLSLPQIHCSSCIWLLERLHQFQEGIVSSRVNFLKREAYITFNKSKTSLRQVVELLTSIGYEPNITLDSSADQQSKKQNNSKFYAKLGIAGFCFGNIMLLAFPEYLSLDDVEEHFQKLFGYLSFGLALPVFLYSASDYYRSAIGSLKKGYFNIDVPVSLGILALFVRSTYDIFFSHGGGFMDSLAGFVFFLLIGKWFQNKTYDTLSFERDYKSYFPLSVTIKKDDKDESILVDKLAKGDIIEVRNEELIPCDAFVMEGQAKIDYSFVTGESDPINKKKGDLVYAGGKQLGASILLQVEKEVSQSYLTRLWNQDIFNKDKEQLNKSIVSNVSQYFTIIVILIATIASIVWFLKDSSQVVSVFTAVLIVACPCALALTLPFAYGNVMRIFGKRGIYLRDADTVEKMKHIDAVVFDKTGTITINKGFDVEFIGDVLSKEQLLAVKSIAKHSNHPLSRALYHFIEEKTIDIVDFEEIPSMGVKGIVDGKLIKLGSAAFVNSNDFVKEHMASQVFVSIDEDVLGFFAIRKKYRDGLEDLVNELKEKYEVYILSGDNDKERKTLGHFIDEDKMYFSQSPEQKLNFIKELQQQGKKVVMIGDGLNDAGALKQSDVGIAVSDNVNTFSPSCDIILAANRFHELKQIFGFSASVQKVVIASFIFSFAYNAVGLIIAVMGMLTPLFAAILMPLSSVTVVLFVSITVAAVSRKYFA